MGCDWYADDVGVIEILISDWKTGKTIFRKQITNLEPNQELGFELLKGTLR